MTCMTQLVVGDLFLTSHGFCPLSFSFSLHSSFHFSCCVVPPPLPTPLAWQARHPLSPYHPRSPVPGNLALALLCLPEAELSRLGGIAVKPPPSPAPCAPRKRHSCHTCCCTPRSRARYIRNNDALNIRCRLCDVARPFGTVSCGAVAPRRLVRRRKPRPYVHSALHGSANPIHPLNPPSGGWVGV